MATSKFIKENARHFYGRYSLEEFEDIIETDHAGDEHNRVNKEHVEVYDEDAKEYERDVGVNKKSHEVNQTYGELTAEDFNVNKGGDGDIDDPAIRRWLENLRTDDCPEREREEHDE